MTNRYNSLSFLIVFISLITLSTRYIPWSIQNTGSGLSESSTEEGVLARGELINLYYLTLYELELIPGVSDTLGEELLRSKDEIQRRCKGRNWYAAYEEAKGIGPKSADKLSWYLDCRSPK